MPPHEPAPGSAEDWLARARGDLAIARLPLPEEAHYEDFCFHAQQASEKALKAVFQHHNWPFRYTHDINSLVSELKAHGVDVPFDVEESSSLTGFAWEARYPGVYERAGETELAEALKKAETVLQWAESIVLGSRPS